MSPDAAWIVGTVITVGAALAGVMFALVRGVNTTITAGSVASTSASTTSARI